MSAPSANTTFDKTTPEKVWLGQGQSYWLSVNGGTVRGDVRVEGAETITGNLTVSGTVNGTKIDAPIIISGATLTSLTNNTNISVFNPGVDIPLVNGGTYEVFVQARATVTSGALSAGDSINLNVTAGASLPADPTAVSGAVMQMSGITADVATGGTQYWNTSGIVVVPSTGTNYLKVGMLAHYNGSLVMSGGALTTVRVRLL
jgi:hypothetical protein